MPKDVLVPGESRFGKDWILYGEKPGLKAEGLQNFQKVASPAVHIPRGILIGSSIFDEFVDANGLTIKSDSFDVDKGVFPYDLWQPTPQIVQLIRPGQVVALRSSALIESPR